MFSVMIGGLNVNINSSRGIVSYSCKKLEINTSGPGGTVPWESGHEAPAPAKVP